MDGSAPAPTLALDQPALSRLMPMHLCLSDSGHVTGYGATLGKLLPQTRLTGRSFFDLFDVRRPGGVTDMAGLLAQAGARLHLSLRGLAAGTLRGVGVGLGDGQGMLLNLSFGIGVIDAVRTHALTDADFAPTDLTVELLYVVEAKSAVMQELRALNLRLQGAKVEAEAQALTDTLTGLSNRRALDLVLARAMRERRGFALMHLDLDFFKAVNDTLGHAAGDHVLREVARTLTAETRAADTVARVGGDEFVLVLPAVTSRPVLREVARRIIARISAPMEFQGLPCAVAASIGIAIAAPGGPATLDSLLADADAALYASKRAGRGRATFADPPGPDRSPPDGDIDAADGNARD